MTTTNHRESHIASGFYSRLVELKRTFRGGSERALVASAIRAQTIRSICTTRILDVGSSDCKNTKKILESTPEGINHYELMTVDPDRDAIAATPIDVIRTHHIVGRFQDIDPSEMPEADVVLFSHSLYYFDNPVAAISLAREFSRPGGSVIIAMWGGGCDLRQIAAALHPAATPPLGGGDVFHMIGGLGPTHWHGTWRGSIDLNAWRDSQTTSLAAAQLLCPACSTDGALTVQKVSQALSGLGPTGTRENVVFSLGVV